MSNTFDSESRWLFAQLLIILAMRKKWENQVHWIQSITSIPVPCHINPSTINQAGRPAHFFDDPSIATPN
jgi:hypothetical protein